MPTPPPLTGFAGPAATPVPDPFRFGQPRDPRRCERPVLQGSRSGPDGPYGDFYVWSDADDGYPDARIIFVDTEASNWTFDQVRGQYYWHRFFSHQPDLNYDNPKVQDAILAV